MYSYIYVYHTHIYMYVFIFSYDFIPFISLLSYFLSTTYVLIIRINNEEKRVKLSELVVHVISHTYYFFSDGLYINWMYMPKCHIRTVSINTPE